MQVVPRGQDSDIVADMVALGWVLVRVDFSALGDEAYAYVLGLTEKQAWLTGYGLVKGQDYRIVERQKLLTGYQGFTVSYCWLFKEPKWANWFILRWV